MTKAKILLVDNSKFYLELEKGFLRRTDAELITAGNGVEALDLVRTQVPDLIYMEQDLPHLDGVNCCRQIKNDAFLKKIPVIMIYEPANCANAVFLMRDSGCQAVLKKPLQRLSFLDMGRQYLSMVERREQRVACRQLVVVRQEEKCFCGTSVDLSEGGMYVRLDQEFRVRDSLNLSFVLPGAQSEPIEAVGRVAWTNQGAQRPKPALPQGFGVEFKSVSSNGSGLLKQFVAQRLVSPGSSL